MIAGDHTRGDCGRRLLTVNSSAIIPARVADDRRVNQVEGSGRADNVDASADSGICRKGRGVAAGHSDPREVQAAIRPVDFKDAIRGRQRAGIDDGGPRRLWSRCP